MRKVKYLVLLGVVLVLGACSKSPKEEFIAAYESLGNGEYNTMDFTVSMSDIEVPETTGTAQANMLNENLKNMHISGSYQDDDESESYRMKMAVEAFGAEMPMELVGNENQIYLSTSFAEGIVTFMDSFGTPLEVDQAKLDEYKGKYINVESEFEKLQEESTSESSTDAGTAEKEMKSLLEKGKEEDFKKDGDTYSYTFSKTEVKKIVEKYTSGVEDIEIPEASITMKINSKTKKTEHIWRIENPEPKMKMTLKVKVTPSNSDKKVSMPKEEEITEAESINALLADIQPVVPVEDTVSESDMLTDEEFNNVLQLIGENGFSQLPLESRLSLLYAYESKVTPEQLLQLRALLE